MGGSGREGRSGRRVAFAFLLLLGFVAAVAVVVFQAAATLRPAPRVAGAYRLDEPSPCLGDRDQRLRLEQSGQFVDLDGPGRVAGGLRLRSGQLDGTVTCRAGGQAWLTARADGTSLRGTAGGAALTVTRPPQPEAEAEAMAAARAPGAEETFGQLMLAIAVVMLAARATGAAVA
ncbi:MAG TPA: hypothetical protein VF880_02635, partial [Actinomycetes bacterium]